MTDERPRFPAEFSVDYPDRELDRLTTFFRAFMLVPIVILLVLVAGPVSDSDTGAGSMYLLGIFGMLCAPVALMLLFRQKYPRWWYDWNVDLAGFALRVACYGLLLRDEYPSTDEEQSVHVRFEYPDATKLNRWLPLVKWLLVIPHAIVLAFLDIAVNVCVVIAWFAILFTGRYPRSLFDFCVGVVRWHVRVLAYAFMLTTDEYPPFSLD